MHERVAGRPVVGPKLRLVRLSNEVVADLFRSSRVNLERFVQRRLPDNESAKDIAQDAFLRLLRFNKADQVDNPEAYLFRIAANLISEYWSNKTARMPMSGEVDDFDLVGDDEQSLDTVVEKQQQFDELQKALEHLPEIQKNVLLLHRQQGFTYDEIAAKLGISRDMVKKHLSKALVRCRDYLMLTQGN